MYESKIIIRFNKRKKFLKIVLEMPLATKLVSEGVKLSQKN